jgi:16S rRNA C1402 (ribose-2'-O) methylase RsmI
MRLDDLSPSERESYENYIKFQRIRLGEIDTAWEGGKDEGKEEARKEFLLIVKEAKAREEEAKAREEEERKQKIELKNTLKQTITQLQSLGMNLAQIEKMLNKSNDEINEILS